MMSFNDLLYPLVNCNKNIFYTISLIFLYETSVFCCNLIAIALEILMNIHVQNWDTPISKQAALFAFQVHCIILRKIL